MGMEVVVVVDIIGSLKVRKLWLVDFIFVEYLEFRDCLKTGVWEQDLMKTFMYMLTTCCFYVFTSFLSFRKQIEVGSMNACRSQLFPISFAFIFLCWFSQWFCLCCNPLASLAGNNTLS